MEGYLGVVTCYATNFAPKNWAVCSGQLLPINLNAALFSLLGTTYGGNGVTTFALPDLRGRTPVGAGQGPGLSSYVLGQVSGSETRTLVQTNLPVHTHPTTGAIHLSANSNDGSRSRAGSSVPAKFSGAYAASATGSDTMATPTYSTTIGLTGGNQPISIRAPYTTTLYIICINGLFPARN